MDWTNLARELFTVFCFVSFLVFAWVAYSRASKARYKDAASMIIEDDDTPREGIDPTPGKGAQR